MIKKRNRLLFIALFFSFLLIFIAFIVLATPPEVESSFGNWGYNRGSTVNGDFVYVTEYDGVHAVNVSDVTNPVITSNYTNSGYQFLDLETDGNYLYVSAATHDSLEVFNISDPSQLVHIASVQDATKLDNNHGINLSSDGKYVYCCAYLSDYFTIVDVSDPANPYIRGSIQNHDYFNGIHDVISRGDYAYVGCHYNSDETEGSFVIVNVSDPDNPSVTGVLQCPEIRVAADVCFHPLDSRYAFVQGPDPPGVNTIDISDPANPKLVESLNVTKTDGYIFDAQGMYLYGVSPDTAGSSDSNIFIIDISDPLNLQVIGRSKNYPVTSPDSLLLHIKLFKGNYLVVANHCSNGGTKPYYVVNLSKISQKPILYNPYPSNSSDNIPLQPTLYINCTDYNNDNMNLSWYENSSGSWKLVQTNQNIVDGRYAYTFTNATQANTRYWWKVKIGDGSGNYTERLYSFTTRQSVDGPEFISIDGNGNGTLIHSSTPTIIWDAMTNASQYHLQIDNNNDFSSPEINFTSINQWNYPDNCNVNNTQVSFTIPNGYNLSYGIYYMRVRAYT